MAGTKKKQGVRITPVIDADVAELLREAVFQSRGTISGFVQDALAVRLANHERPKDYITGKRTAKDKTPRKVFDPGKFNEFGFPLGQFIPSNPRAEVGQALRRGKDEVRNFVRQYWSWNGLDPDDYTDAMLEETMRVYAASKGGQT